MPSLYHNPLLPHIREYLAECPKDETVFLFVPYVKTSVLEALLENTKGRVVLVTTWNPSDMLSGASDLSVYQFCMNNGIALYVNENMHLKVYSVGLESAILATGNISQRGLMPGGNYEAAAKIERLTNEDRLFFSHIRNEARLVDDNMYEKLMDWYNKNKTEIPELPRLSDIVPESKKDDFSVASLPMTSSVDVLVSGYAKMSHGLEPSENKETAACIFHDLATYSIPMGLSDIEFRQELSNRFFDHPFIQRMAKFISPEAYFGRLKEWIQNNCTDVPIPSRREITGNVQVLLEWFVELGDGRYVVDVPGKRSQRIRRIDL